MEKKYILTDETIECLGHTLHRIKAVKDFATISAGTLGGYIESEGNLNHIGNAWVSDSAVVSGSARVTGDAVVTGAAHVSDSARVTGDAVVTGDAHVSGSARVTGDAVVTGDADFAVISGFGRVFRTTTFFRCKDNLVRCQCGCFYGTVDEFRSKVRETHGSSKYAKEYLMIADLMELHFKED